jgi:DNA-binding response OmpR family regulator
MTDQSLAGCRILIVEDDYYQAQDCMQMLESVGAKVVAACATIPDLSRLMEDGPIDVVLIDINLGHGLSFDFARELKARAIPFVFLTGYDTAMLPEDLAESPYLSKPADWTHIVAALAGLARNGEN